jgi:hypothetical protein
MGGRRWAMDNRSEQAKGVIDFGFPLFTPQFNLKLKT